MAGPLGPGSALVAEHAHKQRGGAWQHADATRRELVGCVLHRRAGMRRSRLVPDVVGASPTPIAHGGATMLQRLGFASRLPVELCCSGLFRPRRRDRATVLGVILERFDIDATTFEQATGWAIKPEGACKGEICVPLPGGFELTTCATRLGMSLVHDDQHGLWALGPESIGSRALVTAQAPELVLDDIDGVEFRLSSLRGQKVVLVSWAPY